MKVSTVETILCDAGWRNYYFVKLTTENGIVGWSEYDEGFGSPGVGAIIEQIGRRLVGKDIRAHERFFQEALCLTRPAPGSVIAQAIGALENALLDAKAKHLGVPCYELLGGKLRDEIPVYWSHCATWRINHPTFYQPRITDLDGVKSAAQEVRAKGFSALKSNLFIFDEGDAYAWRPGFAAPFAPELNVDRKLIRNLQAQLEALRDGAGPDVEILIDFNFNAKPEGMLKLLRAIDDFDLFWVETDSFNAKALAYVRSQSRQPIASCETLIGVRGFMPFLEERAIDVGIVDTVWNGVWQSMKIAAVCEAHDVNVAPHNFYGDLCTMMNLHFAAAVPNLRIMEVDVDRLAWEGELYTHQPEFRDGKLVVPDRPGWGCDPIESALRARPPKGTGGLLQYKKTA
ncbi:MULTISPECIES: mandelate racemase/muconate lactonizing enzyme family protein [unclassified Delftia]|uniref:mandelate racemase/muconate lactonizing enzyme family protein n=1 Tax=unclassified Delftia TaxID=2613839 RepID=UPI001900406A|nr:MULTISPECIES: mandelate racemase/muconate lactonizing enzyme family protein [unclassified Delftia]MBK0114069.1 mandelate racemase/muconate lactonizing enzyme family protein [Delftia sp. S65]MBK0117877.1 mandelate racemase/muconate lactonizing enzyme family protein [Delftia sp. S67]MBK0129124.1 mandelate racemase/muconate lactonizing enzyme family protein [Delftia sp. S66]